MGIIEPNSRGSSSEIKKKEIIDLSTIIVPGIEQTQKSD